MLALLVPRTASNCALPPFKAVSTYYAADARTRERKVASWVPHLQRSSSRSRRSPRLPYQPGWAKWQHLRTCSRIQVCSKPSRSRCVSLALALGSHDLIDFVAVLIGYVLSGEPTRLPFYERLTLVQRMPSWLSSGETACPIARPCPDFWQPSTRTR